MPWERLNTISNSPKGGPRRVAYLVTKLGLNPVLLAARGNGESQLADVTNPENAINRRVQVLNIGETQ